MKKILTILTLALTLMAAFIVVPACIGKQAPAPVQTPLSTAVPAVDISLPSDVVATTLTAPADITIILGTPLSWKVRLENNSPLDHKISTGVAVKMREVVRITSENSLSLLSVEGGEELNPGLKPWQHLKIEAGKSYILTISVVITENLSPTTEGITFHPFLFGRW